MNDNHQFQLPPDGRDVDDLDRLFIPIPAEPDPNDGFDEQNPLDLSDNTELRTLGTPDDETEEDQHQPLSGWDKMSNCLEQVIDSICAKQGISRERIEATQKPIVEKVLHAYIDGKKNYIIEAPTGAGKSIIGLMITESIYRYNNYSSAAYTLTPSKILQDQLDADNERFSLGWALLKGQSNYMCPENGENFTKRKCIKLSISKAEKLKCASGCEYIQKRRAAIESHNSVLSYAYWLTSLNFIYENIGDVAPFQPREVTVFDECHMLTDIVQGTFAVELSTRITKSVLELVEFTDRELRGMITGLQNAISVNSELGMITQTDGSMISIEQAQEQIDVSNKSIDTITVEFKLFEQMVESIFKGWDKLSNQDIHTLMLKSAVALFRMEKVFVDYMRRYFPKQETLWTVDQQKFDKNYEKFSSIRMNLGYFVHTNQDVENIVIDRREEQDKSQVLMFRTLNEPALMKRHVHRYSHFSVWTSATLGGEKGIITWAAQNAIENYGYTVMDSNFRFPDSPIYMCSPALSLSYKDKETNMQSILLRTMAIVDQHKGQRGIIHTGNFEIARNLQGRRSDKGFDRLIFYGNSYEKELAIKKLADSTDGIIVGPSLSEGLDLKDDLARFCILVKVPYPSLADNLNKLKLQSIDGWYNWATVVTIMQQFGRAIRHADDYATTYLLDLNFDRVISQSTFPDYIAKRFGRINVNKIVDSFTDDAFADLL